MGDVVLAEARSQGFEPDADVCRDEVKNGRRPSPAMLYKNLDLLDVHPIQAVVKVFVFFSLLLLPLWLSG